MTTHPPLTQLAGSAFSQPATYKIVQETHEPPKSPPKPPPKSPTKPMPTSQQTEPLPPPTCEPPKSPPPTPKPASPQTEPVPPPVPPRHDSIPQAANQPEQTTTSNEKNTNNLNGNVEEQHRTCSEALKQNKENVRSASENNTNTLPSAVMLSKENGTDQTLNKDGENARTDHDHVSDTPFCDDTPLGRSISLEAMDGVDSDNDSENAFSFDLTEGERNEARLLEDPASHEGDSSENIVPVEHTTMVTHAAPATNESLHTENAAETKEIAEIISAFESVASLGSKLEINSDTPAENTTVVSAESKQESAQRSSTDMAPSSTESEPTQTTNAAETNEREAGTNEIADLISAFEGAISNAANHEANSHFPNDKPVSCVASAPETSQGTNDPSKNLTDKPSVSQPPSQENHTPENPNSLKPKPIPVRQKSSASLMSDLMKIAEESEDTNAVLQNDSAHDESITNNNAGSQPEAAQINGNASITEQNSNKTQPYTTTSQTETNVNTISPDAKTAESNMEEKNDNSQHADQMESKVDSPDAEAAGYNMEEKTDNSQHADQMEPKVDLSNAEAAGSNMEEKTDNSQHADQMEPKIDSPNAEAAGSNMEEKTDNSQHADQMEPKVDLSNAEAAGSNMEEKTDNSQHADQMEPKVDSPNAEAAESNMEEKTDNSPHADQMEPRVDSPDANVSQQIIQNKSDNLQNATKSDSNETSNEKTSDVVNDVDNKTVEDQKTGWQKRRSRFSRKCSKKKWSIDYEEGEV